MIEIIDKDVDELSKSFNSIDDKHKRNKIDCISPEIENEILEVLRDKEFTQVFQELEDNKLVNNVDYDKLSFIDGILEVTYKKINEIKSTYDINFFLKNGYTIDREKLKSKLTGKVSALHPDIDVDKLCDLYENPIKKLKVNYSNEEILVDPFVFRKYVLGIIQMIFNDMDLVVAFTGPEGSGKSTRCSQDMYLLWWILTKVGIIDYKFDIKDTFFNTLHKFREAEEKYFDEKYRILALDEGNELNRQNWKDEEVQMFFQKLRRERFNKRIKFICIPVLGELLTNIVLSRVNFVFELELNNNIKSGTLEKGQLNFYIIPRAAKIYSPEQKKELSRHYIKTTLQDNLKDKSYLKGVPKELVIKKIKTNGVWGFPEKEYIKELKDSNSTFTINKQLSISEGESYCLFRSGISVRKMGIKSDEYFYHPINKVLQKVRRYWENNIDLLGKYDLKRDNKEMSRNGNNDDS